MNTTPEACTDKTQPRLALVVDDEPDTRTLIGYTLERGGWKVCEAAMAPRR